MVVDDSAVVRQVATAHLQEDPAIEVMCAVPDPLFAIERMKQAWPDVIVLDIEMPRMDGLTFLRKLMAQRPTPVVVCSSLTKAGTETSIAALSAGAVSIVPKPAIGVRRQQMEEAAGSLVQAVKHAARVAVQRLRPGPPAAIAAPASPSSHGPVLTTTDKVVAIGTSTGGTQALEQILSQLPHGCPGLVVVQHMPEKFTTAFAKHLNGLCHIEVREAQHGDRVIPGCALIAPGGRHMQLRRSGAQYHVDVVDGPPVSRHRPSVDVLFRSVAQYAGRNAFGFLLTGMGDDGARGLKDMREAGARTFAQDEASSVVFGMPKEAIKLGAAEEVVALSQVPHLITNIARPSSR